MPADLREDPTWPGLVVGTAFASYVHIRLAEPEPADYAVTRATEILDAVDLACSRFRADSELSIVNSRPGRYEVSPVFAGALRVALEAAHETDGLVDPTLGARLSAAGYAGAESRGAPTRLPGRAANWRDIVLDDHILTVPDNTFLDLGATGKAYAADLLAECLAQETGSALIVSLGGDIAVRGTDELWPVVIAHRPADVGHGPAITSLRIGAGGLATSSVSARRWRHHGSQWHHILDPRTGLPAQGPWVTVTALGSTSVAANVASTAAMVLGAAAYDWLTRRDVAALLVTADGFVQRTPAWTTAVPEAALDSLPDDLSERVSPVAIPPTAIPPTTSPRVRELSR